MTQPPNKGAGVDPLLKNIANALYFTTSSEVAIRTGIDGDINITGPVTIPGTVNVNSSPEDPVHVHLTEVGTFGTLTNYIPIQGSITGSVTVNNFPTTSTVYQGAAPWTITGTVNVGTMPEIEIKNDTGNPLPVSANTSSNNNTNPIYVKGVSDASFFAPTQSDAFGRLRVSDPYTLFDSFNRFGDNGQCSYSTATGGTYGYDANNACVTMSVTTANGSAVYRETNRVFAYQPGKSLLVMQTFTFNAAKSNLTQRAGYFDASNGVYLEQDGTSTYFVLRSSSSGILTETRKIQSLWSENTLPTLDLSKSQIFWMDIEWLGVGGVRCGFVIDGVFVHCHTFHHANNITGTYMTTSCLPIRKEIFNTGVTTSTSTLLSICSSVVSEGGYSLTGRSRCIGHNLGTPVSLPNDSTEKPIISIRLKSGRLGAIVLPSTFTVTPIQQAVYKYQIYTKAVTTGGTWISAGADSSVEYNLNPTSITTGTVANSAFINATNQTTGVAVNSPLPFTYQLERNVFTGQTYEIVVAAASSGNSTTAYGNINWEEIT
jgi:hypothetical protein